MHADDGGGDGPLLALGDLAEVVRRELPFKATAGLHRAIRNTAPGTGFEQHGFLNILLAVDAALGGAPVADLAAVLADRDAAGVAARVAGLGEERIAAARARFTSFGTCSIDEPLADLAALGLTTSGGAIQ